MFTNEKLRIKSIEKDTQDKDDLLPSWPCRAAPLVR